MAIKYLVCKSTQRWNVNYKYAKWDNTTDRIWIIDNNDEEEEMNIVTVGIILDSIRNDDLLEEISIVECNRLIYDNKDFYII